MRKTEINQLKAGSILSYINIGISCIIPLLYTPIMLRILGREEYGIYSLSNSIIGYLTILNFGMGNAVGRYVTKCRAEGDKENLEKMVGLFLTIYMILSSLVCIVGFSLTNYSGIFFGASLSLGEIQRLRILIIIMTISTAISFPSSVFSSVITSHERYIFRKLVDMFGTILAPVFNLVMLLLGYASVGMALAGMFLQILTCCVNILYCVKSLKIKPQFWLAPKELLKEIFGFSGFIFLMTIVDMLYWATDKVLIGAFVGTAAVAIYNVGGTFTAMLQNMAAAISSVFIPRITTMVVKNESVQELSALFIRVGRLQYIIVSLILSGYIAFGRIFIDLWAGKDYSEAYFIALLTMVPLGVPLIQNVGLNIVIAQNKHKFRTIVYALIAVINVVSTYFCIPKYGIIGAAVCTCISYIIGNIVVMNIYYFRVTGLDIPCFWKNIFKMSVVPCILLIVTRYSLNRIYLINNIRQFIMAIGVYTLLFMICSWKISMNNYERDLFKDLSRKVLKVLHIRKRGM